MWRNFLHMNRQLLNRILPAFVGARKADLPDVLMNQREILNEVVRELKTTKSKNVGQGIAFQMKNQEALSSDELYELARSYYEGTSDIVQDVNKAIQLWIELKQKGHVQSTYDLALCKKNGVLPFQKNSREAFLELNELATKYNLNIAHYAVANMLYDGEGTDIDYPKALHHFKQAVKTGVPPALYNIANMYATGIGTDRDDSRAYQFYEAAAECGDPAAQFTVACWLSHGRGVARDDEKSFQIFLSLANKDHPIAAFNIGVRCFTGVGTSKDYDLARQWFEKAARSGMPEAAINLGNMYLQGVGVTQDLNKAIEVFELCASSSATCKQLIEETKLLLAKS